MRLAACAVIALFVLMMTPSTSAAQTACSRLQFQDFSTVVDAPTQIIEFGTYQSPGLPTYCRVRGYVSEQVGFELRMPVNDWNDRLLFQGCGGFCGSLRQIEDCNDALARGYACVTTDLGHQSTPIDGKWAYNNRRAEIDFYYRATHVTTLAAKAIVEYLAGKPPVWSYIRGCSTGGRQGLISAQRFPEDFDGVIAGAPAGVSPGGGLHLIWSALANQSVDGSSILSEADVDVVHERVLDACDELDGVRDGIIANPQLCDFDPGTLSCDSRRQRDCFSEDKVNVVRSIYSGAVDNNGRQAYRAVPMPGSEPHWVPSYVNDSGPPIYYLFGGDFFRYLAFDEDPGPTWNPEDFDLERDLPRLRFMRMLNNAANPDLTNFAAKKGKIILFQGWSDESVPPLSIVDYFQLSERTMGGREAMSDLARLYMLPGVAHCGGGVGADSIDFLTLLERWVEQGEAPGAVVASKLQSVKTGTYYPYPLESSDVAFQWSIAPYPGESTPLIGVDNEVSNAP